MRNGEPQKLLGSGEGALVLKVHRGGAHKGWKGAGPRIISPGGSSPVPITEGSSVGGQGEASHARVGTSDGLIVAHVPDLCGEGETFSVQLPGGAH